MTADEFLVSHCGDIMHRLLQGYVDYRIRRRDCDCSLPYHVLQTIVRTRNVSFSVALGNRMKMKYDDESFQTWHTHFPFFVCYECVRNRPPTENR